MNNKSYRDELVARIKDAGQELINRAEQMVSENTDSISGFSIYLRLDTEDHRIPSIEWSAGWVNEKKMDEKLEQKVIEVLNKINDRSPTKGSLVINKNSYNWLFMKGE